MATSLIIGADRGIGLSISRQLAARGETVMSVCLNEGKACEGAGIDVIPNVDVTSGAAVANMADALAARGARIDWMTGISNDAMRRACVRRRRFRHVRRFTTIEPSRPRRQFRGAKTPGGPQ